LIIAKSNKYIFAKIKRQTDRQKERKKERKKRSIPDNYWEMKDVLCDFNLRKHSSSARGVNFYIKAYICEWVHIFSLICIYMITS
jgi:hypothetical protein